MSRENNSQILYKEKLYPAFWVWLVQLGVASSFYLVFAPINPCIGIIVSVTLFVVLVIIFVASTPKIEVTQTTFSAGKGHIERTYLGKATYYKGEDARREKSTNLHGLAFMVLRDWIKPVVKVSIEDSDDSHPYWLVSSRNPEALTQALNN